MKPCFQNTGFGWWKESQIAETLRTPAGGDAMKANLVIDTLVFDKAQITSKQNGNRPEWGGAVTQSPQETQNRQL